MEFQWLSWEEYNKHVNPSMVKMRSFFTSYNNQSTFNKIKQIEDSRERFENALHQLYKLGYSTRKILTNKPNFTNIKKAYGNAIIAIRAGEELLLYLPCLERHSSSYGFLHQNQLPSIWKENLKDGDLVFELYQLYQDGCKLLEGITQLVEEDERFLVNEIKLPIELQSDFILARDLFSVGLSDIGLLITGRGLEGVLRNIASIRRIMIINSKGIKSPVSEVDSYDLIETIYRVRWKVSNNRLISSQNRHLLHYLRTLRNEGAHPKSQIRNSPIKPKESAAIVVETANQLWNDISNTHKKLDKTEVIKDW